jgi:hypothetical protein
MPAKITAAIRQRAERIKLFLCNVVNGLKALNKIAQGNALGSRFQPLSALKGRNKIVATVLSRPFRAHHFLILFPRALPWAIL